jgi:hypothetical protein
MKRIYIREFLGNDPHDLVLIERSGVEVYYNEKDRAFDKTGLDLRVLRFWPKVKRYGTDFWGKDPDEQARLRYEQAREKDGINCSFGEFVSNPAMRLIGGRPDPDRRVLLYDDVMFEGETIRSCRDDFVSMGYPIEKIFATCDHSIYHVSRWI